MTTNAATTTARPPASPSTDAPAVARFPDFPPRSDMMNTRHIHDDGSQSALRLYLGQPDTTIVLGEVPLYWEAPRSRTGVRVPDLLIAFDVRPAHILAQEGYAIREQGKPPDFVLEVASDSTAWHDETGKWADYAGFGVAEYWLYDPDWGQRYARGLAGWTLVNGRYEPIAIHEYAAGMHYGYSAVLGLYVCWEQGKLRWYDPAAGYLRTHDEEHSGRIAAETERDEEHSGRIAAETERGVAEAERDDERSARIAAEAEVQRLRDEIARLRGATDGA